MTMIVSDGGELHPTPSLATRTLADGAGVALSELLWGVAVWLAQPWIASGRIALGREGFELEDVPVGDLLDRARDHGALAILYRLGAALRDAWRHDASAPAIEPARWWRDAQIFADGRIPPITAHAHLDQAIGELYGYYLVQDCAIFDVVTGPLATGLWGTQVEPAVPPAEPFTPADARAVFGWLRAAGDAARAKLAAPVIEEVSAPFYLPAHEATTTIAFPRDARSLRPSFALPLGLHGFHSGWMDDSEVDPRSALGFASRRVVRLRAIEPVVAWRAAHWRDGALPVLVKHVDGAFVGVTSGAGGALIPFGPLGDRVLKLKRCGYKYLGIQANATRDRKQVLRDGVLVESTYAGAMGLGEVDDLLAEAEAFEVLAQLGVPAASRPSLLVGLAPGELALDPPAACMITEVTTDVRADEVFVLALTDDDPEDGRGLDAVRDLGRAIGGLYRVLHDARVVRGNGNSWYGNDALCADGSIALCDLEGILPEAQVTPAIHRLFRDLDLHMFRAGVFVSCNTIRGPSARTHGFARELLRAFDFGYTRRGEPHAPRAAAYVADKLRAAAQNA